jgi:hypothetical protein
MNTHASHRILSQTNGMVPEAPGVAGQEIRP